MTLIALSANEQGILLLGDRFRAIENNPVPQADACKVDATADGRVAFALFGDVPIPDLQGGCTTSLWLADFISQSIPAGSPPLYAAVRLEHALRNPALGNRVAVGGGFLVTGYEGDRASAFEIVCKSKSNTDPTLDIGSWELPQASFWGRPLLRGCRYDFDALRQEVNLAPVYEL
jgi:hypothetical protein